LLYSLGFSSDSREAGIKRASTSRYRILTYLGEGAGIIT
jgi:hypothetical protein